MGTKIKFYRFRKYSLKSVLQIQKTGTKINILPINQKYVLKSFFMNAWNSIQNQSFKIYAFFFVLTMLISVLLKTSIISSVFGFLTDLILNKYPPLLFAAKNVGGRGGYLLSNRWNVITYQK